MRYEIFLLAFCVCLGCSSNKNGTDPDTGNPWDTDPYDTDPPVYVDGGTCENSDFEMGAAPFLRRYEASLTPGGIPFLYSHRCSLSK